jgi:hypothetical protein
MKIPDVASRSSGLRFLSRFVLVVPQIAIEYDEARFGRGYGHAPALFRLRHGIEMRMPLVHA